MHLGLDTGMPVFMGSQAIWPAQLISASEVCGGALHFRASWSQQDLRDCEVDWIVPHEKSLANLPPINFLMLAVTCALFWIISRAVISVTIFKLLLNFPDACTFSAVRRAHHPHTKDPNQSDWTSGIKQGKQA